MHNEKLRRLIQWHLYRHKNLEIQDVYKMLFQGVFGAEHLLNDVERAKAYLEEEWRRVPADKNVVLIEPVSVDGKINRVNIQRCKAEGIDRQALWEAFYASVSHVHADKNEFEKTWVTFAELCRTESWPFLANEVTAFGQDTKSENWPAKHHTSAYREVNYPAYRVLLKSEFNNIININLDGDDYF